jgi:hypothetical protein
MKHKAVLIFLIFFLLFLSRMAPLNASQITVDFKVSRPHCVLYLIETLRGAPHHSSHLGDMFYARRGRQADDARLIKAYQSLYKGPLEEINLPAEGGRDRNLADALEVIAVNSSTTEEFLRHTRVILPAADHHVLCEIIHHFEPLYNDIFWNEGEAGVGIQLLELDRKAREIGFCEKMEGVAGIMGSEWPEGEGFVVALVPVPRKPGEHFTAFGHANGFLEVVEAPCGSKTSHALGIVSHEICHTLWSNRSDRVREAFKQWFASDGAQMAYMEINEALATAIGNAWVASLVSGKTPEDQWYSDSYVDGFAKGIFEQTKIYCLASRPLDRDFALSALATFRKTFPHAEDDPTLFMREIFIVTNSDEALGEEFRFHLTQYAPVHGFFGGSPVDHEKTRKKFLEYSGTTTLFLLRPDELDELNGYGLDPTLLDELKRLSKEGSSLLLKKKTPTRWLLFAVAPTLEGQEKALKVLFEKVTKQESDAL